MFSRLFSSSKLEVLPSPEREARPSEAEESFTLEAQRDFVKDKRTYRKTVMGGLG